MDIIKEKLKTLPAMSGVYIMYDEYGNVLYVGKAKILKNRVRQYFHNNLKNEKTSVLVSKIRDLNYIITKSEYEALILENNLIKQYNPPYNILLKDDKTYPYIRIDLKQKYPKPEISRRMRSDGAKYFGPYMLGASVVDIIELIHAVFPIRECKSMPKKVCLNYHIGRCCGPCEGKVGVEGYHAVIDKVIRFLDGNYAEVECALRQRMSDCAEKEEFELAKRYRDYLNVLEILIRKQSIPFKQNLNLDVFTFVTNGVYSVVNCFAVRGGKFLGGNNYPYNDVDCDNGLTSFIMQYYEHNHLLCNEIIVSKELEFGEELSDYLSQKAGRKITCLTPSGGIRKQLIDLGLTNAEEYLKRQMEHYNKYQELTLGAVKQLQEYLFLPKPPNRIECYDISHISGTNKVASMVVFINGEKSSKYYRHFNIRTVKGNNDFACMYETLSRRLEKIGASEDISFNEQPDLIVIDGGKGQLSYALQASEDVKKPAQFISLAKREEEVFVPGKEESIILPRASLALKLIIRARDEAHRFAITHHRNLRAKKMTESVLTKIDGVGEVKAKALLGHFKTIENIVWATKAELMEVQGINDALADKIIDYFNKEGKENEV